MSAYTQEEIEGIRSDAYAGFGMNARITLRLCETALTALREADRLGLLYIEATNPGIDMDEVRQIRARRGTLSAGRITEAGEG